MNNSLPDRMSPRDHASWDLGLLAAIVLPMLFAVPFLGKAYHVDDPLFVWTAQQIVEHPMDFYGFQANWERSAAWMYKIQQNPPLLSYYLAPFGAMFGWAELVLHLALLPLTALAGAGIYLLARQFCGNPNIALATAIVSPAFLLSATQVMSDIPMLALYVWALYLWIRGVERDTAALCILAGVLIGLGALTKYFAATAIPLLAVYTVMQGPSRLRYLTYFLVPFFMLVGYEFLTYRLYGLGLLADAFSFAQEHRTDWGASAPIKAMNTLVFLGGCVLPVLCLLPWMLSQRALRVVLGLFAVTIAVCYLLPNTAPEWLDTWHPMKISHPLNFADPGMSIYRMDIRIRPLPPQMAQWALWLCTGILIFGLFVADIVRHRDAKSLLLLLWFVGTFVFVAFVNHHVNARVILPVVPAVAMVCARRMEAMEKTPSAPHPLLQAWPLAPALVLSLVLATADYRLAGSAKEAAHDIMAAEYTGTVWFSGHSGFQYYMEDLGAESIDVHKSFGMPGDTFVQPSNNWFPLLIGPHVAGEHEIIEYAAFPFVTTSHFQRYAGFYSDYTGPLPFMFGSIPMEQYLLVEIRLQINVGDI